MSVAHYENFPGASFLLQRRLRPAVLAIYRFARAADDLADEGDASPADRLAALDAFDRALDAIIAGQPASTPLFAALAAAIDRYSLSTQPLRELLSAFRQDVTITRYAVYANLLDYRRRSANPLGGCYFSFMASRLKSIWSGPTQYARLSSSSISGRTWHWIGKRIAFTFRKKIWSAGVDETQIGEGRCDDAAVTDGVRNARARALLESGRPLTRVLPWRPGLELRGVLAGGHRILDAIDAAHGDVFRHRPQLVRADWAIIASHAVFPPRRHRLAAITA